MVVQLFAERVKEGRNRKGPGITGTFLIAKRKTLRLWRMQIVVHALERGVQRGSERVDGGDDRDGDAGGDQTVFDRGRAGLILHKTGNEILHDSLHVFTWLSNCTGPNGVLSTVTMAPP